MAELKTQKNDGDVIAFLNSVAHEKRRTDSFKVLELMKEVTGETPKMWGDSIVGFGEYTYKYASGREGNWMRTGFSPRKQAITLYIMDGFAKYDKLMKKLGKHKTGVSCLYIKRLGDVDSDVLNELIVESVNHVKEKHD